MGRYYQKTKGRITTITSLSIGILLLLLFGIPGIVQAQPPYDDPDDFELKGAWVFRNLLQFDDFLLIGHYEIQWGNVSKQPDEPLNEVFLFEIRDQTSGANLANATPCIFVNSGYNEGIVSFYFADNAPDWGGNHTFRASANTTWFAAPISEEIELDANDYNDATTLPDMRDDLRDECLEIAKDLQDDWEDEAGEEDMDLRMYTYNREVLSPIGQSYFLCAIPDLDDMTPYLFAFVELPPEWEDGNWTREREGNLTDRWDGTILEDFFDGWGELFGGIDSQTVLTFISFGAMIVLMGIGVARWHKATPGLLVSLPILIISTASGGVALGILALITFACVYLVAHFMIFRTASG